MPWASLTAKNKRRQNEDKNNFWEVKVKRGSAGGSKRGSTGDPPWNFIVGLKHRKTSSLESRIFIVIAFPGNTVTIILDNYPLPPARGLDWVAVRVRELLSERVLVISPPPNLKIALTFFLSEVNWVHSIGVVRQHSVLRRVLRRFWEGFWKRGFSEGFWEGGLFLWVLRVLRKGSQKGVSRRCLERPLGEHPTLGVRPS